MTTPKVLGHQLEKIEEKQFKCYICDRQFFSKASVDRHVGRFHKGKRSHPKSKSSCEICDVKFSNSNALSVHNYRNHNDEKIGGYKCKLCTYTGKKKYLLNQHVISVHSNGRERFQCAFCGMKILKYGMKKHVQAVHLNMRKFSCEQCGEGFKLKANLKKHVETVHERLKRERCDLCPLLEFRCKDSLRSHIQTVHEKVRHSCQKCDKTFAAKCSLRRHIKIVHNTTYQSLHSTHDKTIA